MINYKFSNGLNISYSSNRIYDQTIKGTATNNKLCFGTIASTYVEIVLDNTDGYFDTYSFKNISIDLYDEDKKKIKVYIDSVKEKNRLITIKAYDSIIKLDKTWHPCKTPITLYDFIKDIGKQCNIELNVLVMNNGGFNIRSVEDLKGKTCRQCLSYALELAGFYAYMDSNDKLAFKWFSFNNKKHDITIEHLVDYNTEYENSVVDNIYFIRGSKVFSTNKNPKGSIFISKDNPLLKEASSDKIQEIINKLAHRSQLEYLPCTINATDYFQYTIGDIVTFNDYRGKTRNAIIGSVTYTGHNSCTITSVNVDEQDISTTETENSNTANSTVFGNLYFYRKTGSTDIEFKECNESTEIEYFLNFNVEDAFDSLSVYINNDFYKSFDVHNGNNTICLMLKGDVIKDTVNLIDVMTDNTLENIELNTIYRNCLIIDYSEQNSEVEVGEEENTQEETYTPTYDLSLDNPMIFYAGIESWEKRKFTSNGEITEKVEWSIMPEYSTNLCALSSDELFDNYINLKNKEFRIKVTISGTVTGLGTDNVYNITDAIPDGTQFIYSITRNNDTKYYKSSNGIINVKHGDKICIHMSDEVYKDDNGNIKQLTFNLICTYALIDDNVSCYASSMFKQFNYTYNGKTTNVYTVEATNNSDGNVTYAYNTTKQDYIEIEKNSTISINNRGLMVAEHFYDKGYTITYPLSE